MQDGDLAVISLQKRDLVVQKPPPSRFLARGAEAYRHQVSILQAGLLFRRCVIDEPALCSPWLTICAEQHVLCRDESGSISSVAAAVR